MLGPDVHGLRRFDPSIRSPVGCRTSLPSNEEDRDEDAAAFLDEVTGLVLAILGELDEATAGARDEITARIPYGSRAAAANGPPE